MHWLPSGPKTYPAEHDREFWHRYAPFVLMHFWLRAQGLLISHSFTSFEIKGLNKNILEIINLDPIQKIK